MSRFGFASSISQRLFGSRSSGPFQGLSTADMEELIHLKTLREIPKAKFAATVALKVYPVGRGKKTSYSHVDVYRYVENVATMMREVGVRPGTVCAFSLPNTIESIVYFLAVQCANAVALPIDRNLSEEQMIDVLKVADAKTFVTMDVDEDEREEDESYQKFLRVGQASGLIHWHCYTTRNQGVVLDTHGIRAGEKSAWHGGAGDYGADPESTAVLVVSDAKDTTLLLPLSHKNLCSAAKEFTSTYHLNQTKCTVFTNPVHSVHGMLLLISSFYSGGSLVLVPEGTFNLAMTWDLIEEDGVNYLCISAEDVINLVETAKVVERDTTSKLDFIRSCPGTLGGDISEIQAVLKTSILESYGVAESSGLSTANTDTDCVVGTHGKAVDGCKVKIFDKETRAESPANTEGDIAVQGEVIAASGYLNDEAFNEWAKVTDSNGEVYFCTGDRGKLDDTGNLIVIGNSWAARNKEIDSHNMAALPSVAPVEEAVEEEVRELDDTAIAAAAGVGAAGVGAGAVAAAAAAAPTEEPITKIDEAAIDERAVAEVEASTARAAQFESELPAQEYQAMKDEIAAVDPSTNALVSRALEGDDDDFKALVGGDAVRKQELMMDELKNKAQMRATEREGEEMARATLEADLRTSRMNKERQFMEESEVEFRTKISQIMKISAEQEKVDMESRGDLLTKLREVTQRQAHIEEDFRVQHKTTMDELAIRIDTLNTEIAQLSEANFLAKSAAITNQSAPMLVELKMDEADAAAIAAAASAEEANQNAKIAMDRALAIVEMAEGAAKASTAAGLTATAAAANANKAADVAHEAGMLLPPKKEVEVHEILAEAPENLDSVERRIRVEMADVDKAMSMHPSVEKAMAFPVADAKAGYDIAVAVKTKPGAKVTDTWLKLHAQSILPAMAVPNKWYWIADFPPGITRDEVAVSDDLVDFERLKGRPPSKKTVAAPQFTAEEPSATA